MTSSFNDDVVPQIQALTNLVSGVRSDLTDVQQTLSSTIAFVESVNEENTEKVGLRGLMQCKAIKKSIRRAVAMNCHKYAWHWSIMSILMLIIGPLITIYAIVLWIATA
jgi:hypothetical protein